ncbi:hypothetical protein HDV06_001252 [Boothiomyces sp. JEL0866]|nr:hypothetical protein HDV06_001252 [Boothiomyces sp. JEL0866]
MQEISIAIQNELLHQNSKLKNQLKAAEQQLDNMLIEKQACQQTIQEYTLIIKKKTTEAQTLQEKNHCLVSQEQELYSRIDELEDQLIKTTKTLKQKEQELKDRPEPVIEYRPSPIIQKPQSLPVIHSVVQIEEKECSECKQLLSKINELQAQITDMDVMLKKTQDQYEELMQESYVSLNSTMDQDAIGSLGLDFGSSVKSSPKSVKSSIGDILTDFNDRTPIKAHSEDVTPIKDHSSSTSNTKLESKSETTTPFETPRLQLRKVGSERRVSSVSFEKIPKVERRLSDGPVMWPRFERKDGKIILKDFDDRLKTNGDSQTEDKVEQNEFSPHKEATNTEDDSEIIHNKSNENEPETAKIIENTTYQALQQIESSAPQTEPLLSEINANIFTKLQPVQSNVTLNEASPIVSESEVNFGQVFQNVLGVSEQVCKIVDHLELCNSSIEKQLDLIPEDDGKDKNIENPTREICAEKSKSSPSIMPKPEKSAFKTPEKKANRSYSVQMKTPDRKDSGDTLNKRHSMMERHSIQLDDNFQKFNRNGNNPQLRFIKFDPYTPSIQWSKQIPNQNTKLKVAYVTGIEYGNIPTNRNYPPTNDYFILIQTSDRVIKIVPISWEIHEMWVKALKYILSSIKKHGGLREKVLLAREFCEEFSDSDDESVSDKPRNRIKTVDVEMESVMSPQMRKKTSRPAMKKFEFGFTPKKKFTEYFKVSK